MIEIQDIVEKNNYIGQKTTRCNLLNHSRNQEVANGEAHTERDLTASARRILRKSLGRRFTRSLEDINEIKESHIDRPPTHAANILPDIIFRGKSVVSSN